MHAISETERLLLRPPNAGDISQFVPLLGDFEVAKNLSFVPHPYTEEDANTFIEKTANGWANTQEFVFAILNKGSHAYIGMCGVHPSRGWILGYWIGKPHWGKGYATEAAWRAVFFAFGERGAEKLTAKWYHDNPASGRVLDKLGFRLAGEDMTNCLARGTDVLSHVVELDRATYMTRKMGL